VNSDEKVEVLLAQKSGPLDEGNKAAEAALWERALETYETASPFPKPEDDAYRLYNIGVAYEAMAYGASDEKMIMKYLDQAAINYGKAIDAKPARSIFWSRKSALKPPLRITRSWTRSRRGPRGKQRILRLRILRLPRPRRSPTPRSSPW